MLHRQTTFVALVIILFSCNPSIQSGVEIVGIDTLSVARHIATLASDEYMGRKPFTEGEDKTVAYLATEFRKLGLDPGNGDSYFQNVPLVAIKGTPSPTMTIAGGAEALSLAANDDFVAHTARLDESVALENSELVFAGYGVVAPEYGWNDYEGLDVTGKTVIVLVNDPGFSTGDSTLFKGEVMTYYGRWTYKYEEAARQGAAGVLIIHETVPAGYPWLVVRGTGPGVRLSLDGSKGPHCKVQGWLTRDAAIKIFEQSEVDMTGFSTKAKTKGFQPIPLGLSASVVVNNEIEKKASRNVIAQITGRTKPDEAIIYTAHWDHLGVGDPIDGDGIFNGALDNASGTALLLGIAERFIREGVEPDRTVVFLAVTAEESGLLGSKYYAENPTFVPSNIIANINMDAMLPLGPMRDLTVVGYGQSELDDMAEEIIAKQNRYILPDPQAGKGFFFRSDHFSFAKIGVPAFYASGSSDAVEGGEAAAEEFHASFTSQRYHQPADEFVQSDWRFGSAYQDGNLFFELGERLATSDLRPEWKEGSEFKSLR